MTTYQDRPPQSRREVRASERAEHSPTGSGEPLHYSTQSRPLLPGPEARPQHGRRAAAPQPIDPAAESPSDSPSPPVPLGSPTAPPGAPTAPAGAERRYRMRDYRPEREQAADPAPGGLSWAPPPADGGEVHYRTQARPPASLASQLRSAQDTGGQTAHDTGGQAAQDTGGQAAQDTGGQTLSRRELRALREQASGPSTPTGVSPLTDPSPRLDAALAEYDALTSASRSQDARRGRRSADNAVPPVPSEGAVQPVPSDRTSVTPDVPEPAGSGPAPMSPAAAPDALAPWTPPPGSSGPLGDVAAATTGQAEVPPSPTPPWGAQATASEVRVVEAPASVAEAPGADIAVPTADIAVPPVGSGEPAGSGERPARHWTQQADFDDPLQASESTLTRRVGSGAATTSALVLPVQDLTGEGFLTGSIDLPASWTATGRNGRFDGAELDHLLDADDHQVASTDSIPISAVRAVSGHTGSTGIVGGTPKGSKAIGALIAAAAGMAVVVVALLVVAVMTDVFA